MKFVCFWIELTIGHDSSIDSIDIRKSDLFHSLQRRFEQRGSDKLNKNGQRVIEKNMGVYDVKSKTIRLYLCTTKFRAIANNT